MSLNSVSLIGHLGADPEVRFMPDGKAVASFSIATNEKWNDEKGAGKERTEWHRVIFFGAVAEVARDYLKAGSQVFVEGRLRTRKWEDKEKKVDRYSTGIMGRKLLMLGKNDRKDVQTASEDDSGLDPEIPF